MSPAAFELLTNAYEHYKKTGRKHFDVIPKDTNYLLNVLNVITHLQECGYIENISDTLLDCSSISLVPQDPMSFDITNDGICFVESNRKS